MIPLDFDYVAPESLGEAVAILSQRGEEAKLLAGGHSLLPLMRLRLATPATLVDLRRVPGLSGVSREDGELRIGAMTTHSQLADRPELGVVARAAGLIADRQVRNRGTIGGSLAHADPAADLPVVCLACVGSVTAEGPGGRRTIAADDLFEDYLTTSLAFDEVITDVRLPPLDGWGWGYEKFNRRAEDWATVAVCALVKRAGDGSCEDARVALAHMGPVPVRASAVEEPLRGGPLDARRIAAAAAHADVGTDPPGDLNAEPAYKRHLARVLTRRALLLAAGV